MPPIPIFKGLSDKLIADAEDVINPLIAQAEAIVPTLSADLEGVPWLHRDAMTLSGIAAGLAWNGTTQMIARAIKEFTIEGQAGVVSSDWFIGTFCKDDVTNGDQITLRRVDSPTTTISLGVTPLTKLTNQPTPVVISSAALGLTFRLLIDYDQITGSGVLVNTSTLTVPLIVSRANGPIEREKRNFNAQIKESSWLDPDAPALKGLLKTYNCRWTPDAEAIARAVKDVRLTDGWDTTKRYRITRLAYNATAPNSWRISIGDIAANSIIDTTTATQTPITDSITRIDINNGIQFASLWVDYRELVSGQAYTIADSPLLINNLSARPRNYVEEFLSNVDRRLPYWNLVANGAFDPDIGTYPTGQIQSAYYTTPSSVQSSLGCIQAVAAGSGGKFFYQWEDVLNADSSGKYYLSTMLVHSPDGTTWGNAHFIFYAGAALVGGGSPTGYISLGDNDRIYYRLGQFPVRADLTQFRLGTNSTALSIDNKFSGAQLIISSQRLTMSNTNRNDWYAPLLNKRTAARLLKQVSLGTTSSGFSGKKFSSYGDSNTGNGRWQTQVASALGLGTHVNCGVGGTRFARRSDISDGTSCMCDDARINAIPSDSKLVLVNGLTNDWLQSRPLGTITPVGTLAGAMDEFTVYGALEVAALKLAARFNTGQLLVWMTPIPGSNILRVTDGAAWPNAHYNQLGLGISDYAAAMRAVAAKYSLPLIDLHGRLGWNTVNFSQFLDDESGALIHASITSGGPRMAALISDELMRLGRTAVLV